MRRFYRTSLAAAIFTTMWYSLAWCQNAHFPNPLDIRMSSDGVHATLLSDFSYIDPQNKTWTAVKGETLDGASIPWEFWSIIGSPWTGKYREASVIHDYYCDKKTAPWKAVHAVFYEAMLDNGVNPIQARIMYAAVYRFGPRWDFKYTPSCPDCAAVPYFVKSYTPTFDQKQFDALKAKAQDVSVPIGQIESEADTQFDGEIKNKELGTPQLVH